jgi:RNA polymerase sigma-70 factor, ECF subfamily
LHGLAGIAPAVLSRIGLVRCSRHQLHECCEASNLRLGVPPFAGNDVAGRREQRLCAAVRRVARHSWFHDPESSFVQVRPVNESYHLSVIVDVHDIQQATFGEPLREAVAAVRQLYARYATALPNYVERFCPDRASADDIVQEIIIRAWSHLPQLADHDQPVRPWLLRVARNMLTEAGRAARIRPVTVHAQPADPRRYRAEPGPGPATGDRSPQAPDREHQQVLVGAFYRGATTATIARQLGIPHGTARSRLRTPCTPTPTYAVLTARPPRGDHPS